MNPKEMVQELRHMCAQILEYYNIAQEGQNQAQETAAYATIIKRRYAKARKQISNFEIKSSQCSYKTLACVLAHHKYQAKF